MTADIQIRPMKPDELDLALAWAREEGWNPGLADAECFLAGDPGGFLMAFDGENPVASISVVAYGSGFGFLGFYICRPERRGQGIGYRLWRAGLNRLGDRCIGLDGVVDQQDNYRREGFVLAHRNVRYGGPVTCERPADPRLQPIGPDLQRALLAYDRGFFPGPRGAFLNCWLRPGDLRFGHALVEDGEVRGYGVLRRCHEGYKIGPLFAETPDAADLLFRALAAGTVSAPVFLDPPLPNAAAVSLAESYGMAPVFETARMYRGKPPDLPLQRIFGITTFELG